MSTGMIRWDDMDADTHAWWCSLRVGDAVTVAGEAKIIASLPLSTSPYPTARFTDGTYCYAGAITRDIERGTHERA